MHAGEQQSSLRPGCPPRAGILLAGSVSLLALFIQSSASLADTLQWQRSAGSAAVFTWLTSHLCHWSWNHLLWDLCVFAFFSWLSLRLIPSRYAPCLLAAAVLIPLEVRILQPQLESYRGLSGVDCALLGLLISALWRKPSNTSSRHAPQWLAVISALAFTAKTIYELTTGSTVFVDAGPHAFVPVPSAHLVGFLSGLIVGLVKWNISIRDNAAALTSWSTALPENLSLDKQLWPKISS